MTIKALNIRKSNNTPLDVSWELSGGSQSSYELFLIREGSIIEMAKSTGEAMKCTLHTIVEPMKEYALLLTVKSGKLLSSVRAGFIPDKDAPLYQSVTQTS